MRVAPSLLTSAAKRRLRRRKHELYLKSQATSESRGCILSTTSTTSTSSASSSSCSRRDVRHHGATSSSKSSELLPLLSQHSIWTALQSDHCRPWCHAPMEITQLIAAYANPLHLCALGLGEFLADWSRPYPTTPTTLQKTLKPASSTLRFLGFDMALESWGTLPLPMDAVLPPTWLHGGTQDYEILLRNTVVCCGASTKNKTTPPCLLLVTARGPTLIFHPLTYTWKALPRLKVERYNAMLVNLDNCLYCIGGRTLWGAIHSTCLVLSVCPSHDFSRPSDPPCCNDDESDDTTLLVEEDKASSMDWFGGYRIDPQEKQLAATVAMRCGQWSTLASMKIPREKACGVVCPSLGSRGSILVFGGSNLVTCERYDIAENTWTFLAEMPRALWMPAATLKIVNVVSIIPTTTTSTSSTLSASTSSISASISASLSLSRTEESKHPSSPRSEVDAATDPKEEAVVLVFDLLPGSSGNVFAYHIATDRWFVLPWTLPPCLAFFETLNVQEAYPHDLFVFEVHTRKLWVANVRNLYEVEWRLLKAHIPFRMAS